MTEKKAPAPIHVVNEGDPNEAIAPVKVGNPRFAADLVIDQSHTEDFDITKKSPPEAKDAQASPSSIFDDLAKLRKESAITVKRKVLKGAITVGKPKNNIYFQSHPTVFLGDVLVVIGPEGSDDFYFISPVMKDYWAVKKRLRKVTIAVVYSWPGGAISLWPVNQVDDDCRVKCWKTAQLAFEHSKTEWIQMIWNDVESDYDVTPAEEIKVAPLWPADLNLGNLMKIGFAGTRTIETAEHPYVRQLRGIDT